MTKVTSIKKTKSKSKSNANAESNASAAVAQNLAKLLSDTYVLAVKTHGYHWNVTGPNFNSLHTQFEAQYAALIINADDVAERIRALGYFPDGSMDSFTQNSSITEAGTKPLNSQDMLKDLYASYEILREQLLQTEQQANDVDDIVTVDLVTQQVRENDKTMWMIKSQYE